MRSQEEHVNQVAFFSWCQHHEKYHPGLTRFFAVPNGGDRHPAVAAKLKAEGVRRGVCDVVNLTPTSALEGPMYKGLMLEFKSAKGVVRAEQLDWISHFREQGYRVEVPRSWIEAALIVIDYFGLPNQLKRNLAPHRVK